MKRLLVQSWTVPLIILGVCTLAFGLLIPWLGFYQDDWYQIWFGRTFGSGVWTGYYARERPFIAGLYMLTTPFLGTAPLNWQIFGLFSRWLAAMAVWWVLRQFWPTKTAQIAWVTLLFSIYPGFRQQYASVIYSHYFLQLAIHMVSIGSMALAIRKPHSFWSLTIFSLATSIFSLFTSEYFFGLEVLRPLFIWALLGVVSAAPWWAHLRKTLALWAPYSIGLLAFLFWRIVIFKFPTYQPVFSQNSQSSLWATGLELVRTILVDSLAMGISAWLLPLRTLMELQGWQPSSLAALALTACSFILLVVSLYRLQSSKPEGAEQIPSPQKDGDSSGFPASVQFAGNLLLLGLVGVFTAGLPFWFVDLPVDTDLNSGSRFAISFMLPASMLLVGLLEILGLWTRRRFSDRFIASDRRAKSIPSLLPLIVAALVALAIGHHFKDANYYRQVHRSHVEFFQQLAWRAPGLKPGTLILTNTFKDVLLSGDNSLTAALNWIYDPQPPFALEYMLFYIPSRIESKNLPGLEPGLPVVKEFRTTRFYGSTSQALVLYYPYPHCLRVLDPTTDLDTPRPMQMPREMRDAIRISNLDQINPGADPAAVLPADLFKVQPGENSWCYYYEKADLARQQSDWATVVDLGDRAFAANLSPNNTWELAPFIEGYARSGNLDRARELTIQAHDQNLEARWQTTEILCSTWQRIASAASPGDDTSRIFGEILETIGCE